jgi:GT2 family glycosyltransferase
MLREIEVAIVILNYNKKDYLLDCLKSVYEMDYPSFEVIVVDNCSTDGSAEAVSQNYPQTILLASPENVGAPRGRNIAGDYIKKNIRCNYILFLDNDTEVDKNFLNELVKTFSYAPDIGIVCGKTYTNFKDNIIMSAGIKANFYTGIITDRGAGDSDKGQYDEIVYMDACGAFGFIISSEAYEIAGGWDERFKIYGWEDVELCTKIRENGYKILYNPSAIMCHKGTKLGRDPVPLYERSKVKNYILLMKLHTNLVQKISFLGYLPIRSLILFAKLIKQGNSRIILSHFKGLIDSFSFKKN